MTTTDKRSSFSSPNLFYRLCRLLVRLAVNGCYRHQVFGIEHVPTQGGVLLLSNHQSFLDPIILGIPMRRACHFMARDTLFKNPIFRKLILSLNAYPIKRNSADMGSIRETLRRLKQGALICGFPEGTRSDDGKIAEFKSGMIFLAQRAGVPIILAAIEGMIESWPRNRKLPRLRGQYWLEFSPAVTPDEIRNRDQEELSAELTKRMQNMQNQLRQRIGRTPIPYSHFCPVQ